MRGEQWELALELLSIAAELSDKSPATWHMVDGFRANRAGLCKRATLNRLKDFSSDLICGTHM